MGKFNFSVMFLNQTCGGFSLKLAVPLVAFCKVYTCVCQSQCVVSLMFFFILFSMPQWAPKVSCVTFDQAGVRQCIMHIQFTFC